MALIIRVTTEFGKNSTLSQIHFLTEHRLFAYKCQAKRKYSPNFNARLTTQYKQPNNQSGILFPIPISKSSLTM